jgi:hypothetical protein
MPRQVEITNKGVLIFAAVLITMFLIWYFVDEGERKHMLKGLVGKYPLDTVRCDYAALKDTSLKNVSIILQSDGTYHFFPVTKTLAGYEGTWSISHDPETASYIFSCANGRYQVNGTLSINIEIKNRDYQICFKDAK